MGTIPYRGLVPRLSRQMALSNGMKLALDWLGLALDLLGLAQIGQLTNFCFCEKLTSDWHGLVQIGLDQGLA